MKINSPTYVCNMCKKRIISGNIVTAKIESIVPARPIINMAYGFNSEGDREIHFCADCYSKLMGGFKNE